MDAMLDVDWTAHWRALVVGREGQTGNGHRGDWSEPRANHFARQVRSWTRDPVLAFLEPWLRSAATLIDVGAGTGRHVNVLARRLDRVTAVEPSAAMRAHIEPRDNVTVIGRSWRDAAPAPADLVMCVHVLQTIAEPVPFIEKLERFARKRVFIWMRDSPGTHPAEAMSRPGLVREPWLRDCLLLLRQMGVEPEMWLGGGPTSHRFDSLEEAAAVCRGHLGSAWDDARGRAWLEANLRTAEDGTLVYYGGRGTGGALHWEPRA